MLVPAEDVDEVGHHRQRRQVRIGRRAVDVADGGIDEVALVVAGRLQVAPDGVDGAGPIGGCADDRDSARFAQDAIDVGAQRGPPVRGAFIFAKRSESRLIRTISEAGGLVLPSM